LGIDEVMQVDRPSEHVIRINRQEKQVILEMFATLRTRENIRHRLKESYVRFALLGCHDSLGAECRHVNHTPEIRTKIGWTDFHSEKS